jgi:hypothetical protein
MRWGKAKDWPLMHRHRERQEGVRTMSNLTGAISSLLMSLPLIAVPCLAVFGLPSIGPATAEAESDDAIELGSTSSLGEAATKPPGTVASGFSPIVNAAPASTKPLAETNDAVPFGTEDRSGLDQRSIRQGSGANLPRGLDDAADRAASPEAAPTPVPPASPNAASPNAASPDAASPNAAFADDAFANDAFADVKSSSPATPSGAASATAASSWESIVSQLNAKGITDFYMTNGEKPGEFYFSCSIVTGPKATQRFEAEAASPAAAASAVLAEVEQWQAIH